MYPTPILWFEIGIAVLLGMVFLWTKTEFALFLYGFALGFPDLALPLGAIVNVRVDDVLLLIFLGRILLWTPAPLSRSQRSILLWQAVFFAVCLFSIAVESAQGTPPAAYDAVKMVGCAAIFLVLPLLIQSETRLRFFVAGLICAGIALVIQVQQHLSANGAGAVANFQQFKSAATFDTWNPNTIGQAAILLVFAAGLGWMISSATGARRMIWPCLAIGFALVPAFVFVRGSSLSIAAGFVLFLCLLRRWRSLLLFAVVCLCAVLYLNFSQSRLLEEAATINVSTGEGFSDRYDRWDMAIQAIRNKPIVGQGFGQELIYLKQIGSEGVAHNDCLSVWLELGLGGLVLFLGAILQFIHAGISLCSTPRFQRQGALILALMLTLCLDSLAMPTMYWEKLTTITLSIAVALIGMCEGDEREISVQEVRALYCEPFEQHS